MSDMKKQKEKHPCTDECLYLPHFPKSCQMNNWLELHLNSYVQYHKNKSSIFFLTITVVVPCPFATLLRLKI